MVDSGDYLTPQFHDHNRFDKPILFYWLLALFYKLFGVNLAAARWVSVVFGVLSIPIIYCLAKRLFDRQTALLSAFLLPSFHLFFRLSRWAVTDMALSFFILLGFYFFVRGYQECTNRRGNFILFYMSMALGFLIKGPAAVIIPGATVGLFLFFTSDGKTLSRMRVFQGLGILAAIVLPWFLAMWVLHGDELINHIIGAEIKNRVDNQLSFNFYYFGSLFRYFLPWSLFVIISLAIHLGFTPVAPGKKSGLKAYFSSLPKNIREASRKLTPKEGAPVLLCILWVACTLLLFTFVRLKASRYMLPASPAMALIAADFLSRRIIQARAFNRTAFKFPFIFTVGIYFVLAIATGLVALNYSSTFSRPLSLLILPGFLTSGALMILMLYRWQKNRWLILAMALFQIAVMTPLNGDLIAYLRGYPMQNISRDILKNSQGREWIGVYAPLFHHARLEILTLHPAIRIKSLNELNDFLNTDNKIFILIREQDYSTEIRKLPLTVLTTRKLRVKSKIKLKEAWELLQTKGLSGASEGSFETVVLLTNRQSIINK